MHPVGFEPLIPTSERSQTHAEDRAVTGVRKLALLSIHNEGIALCFLQSVLKLMCWCTNLGITKPYCVKHNIYIDNNKQRTITLACPVV